MTTWEKWARAWLSGEDRSAETAKTARAAAESAEWAAVYAAEWAEWSGAYAARYAAMAAEAPHSVDILSCARRAMV